ncbi:inositol-tetrakisphosphate 1-kinase isoform X1 [Nasonia vitripennis]|uniref:Inositol-tetrakisphosphate 1-kinase n=1 Tax=Nasonia vitripennis TaxID=7425 RepID=A0A7M7QKE7_NASVI|nr:inositol-tetrakisphosphate 1-kinase isoform X1 [Nasonia vitripennis]XP_032457041.1 inositol-tetrakisphosphate 1-kinase isoform X1 [Nasonia vitripennis]
MGDQKRVIGYWISEKKRQKFNWTEFEDVCAKEGFLLKMINIETSLESQGPIHVFFHKLTDILSHAEDGNKHAKIIVKRVQDYIRKHPELIVIDPLENVRNLRNRHRSYEMIHNGLKYDDDVFIPNFVEINSNCLPEIMDSFRENGIKFPCVCKPLIAQGSSDAHKMMVVFNEQGFSDIQPPCVAQNLINHNAILYKIFIVDDKYHIVERPSLKNFYPKDCELMNTIFFNSHDISKSGSNSKWSVISAEEHDLAAKPKFQVFEKIVERIEKIFGLLLVGVDVVIENHTERYAIIDVNAFPGYDGWPDFFDHLVNSIKRLLKNKKTINYSKCPTFKKCLSDDLDSGFESDKRKKQSTL